MLFRSRILSLVLLWATVAGAVSLTANAGAVQWAEEYGGNGHFYEVIVDDASGWDQAESAAIARGGHLVSITSSEEQIFVIQLVEGSESPSGGYWIGLYRIENEPGWAWTDGSPVDYTHWYAGQPNNRLGAENVGQIIWTSDNDDILQFFHRRGFWNDNSSTGMSGFRYDLDRAGFVIETVPEPSSIALLGIGLIALTRRRQPWSERRASRAARGVVGDHQPLRHQEASR